jgi:hypothetical protein
MGEIKNAYTILVREYLGKWLPERLRRSCKDNMKMN